MISASHALHRQERYDESLAVAKEALALAKSSLGPQDESTLMAMFHLAGVYAARRQHSLALTLLNELLGLTSAVHGSDSLALVPVLHAIAEVSDDVGQLDKALLNLQQALDLRAAALGTDDISYGHSCSNLGHALARLACEDGEQSSDGRLKRATRAVELVGEAVRVAQASADAETAIGFVLDVHSIFERSSSSVCSARWSREPVRVLRRLHLELTGEELPPSIQHDCGIPEKADASGD